MRDYRDTPSGHMAGLELDDTDDWLLVALPDRAGWIAKRYVKVAQRQR